MTETRLMLCADDFALCVDADDADDLLLTATDGVGEMQITLDAVGEAHLRDFLNARHQAHGVQ